MAQLGIKYVMAFTCIIVIILGFIMAKRYVLTKEKNALVEKYLPYAREGRLTELSAEESDELESLKASLK
jgi:hypothetical protein